MNSISHHLIFLSQFDLPSNYFIMSEVAEVASAMLDAKIVSMFKKFGDAIDTIHFSDQVILIQCKFCVANSW